MSSDMTRQRAEIEGAIAGRTLCDELREVAETSGDAWAYSDEAGAGGGWQSLTWSQVRHAYRAGGGARSAGDAPGAATAPSPPSASAGEATAAAIAAASSARSAATIAGMRFSRGT